MANGGISWSGRALRFILWRAPLRAAQYTAAGYMATMQDVGRRGLAIAGFGFWVFLLWKLAHWADIQGLKEVAAFLLLVWFWRFFVFVRWVYAMRIAAARARAFQRQQIQLLQQLPGQLQQMARQALPTGGTFTIMGSSRHDDPTADMAREAEAYVRRQDDEVNLLGPQGDMPLGDKFEPMFRLPRFRRRKRGDQ